MTPIPREYLEYRVMRTMGWTHAQLMATPASVIAQVLEFDRLERKHEKH